MLLDELIKLALHNHREPSLLGEGPIIYELWCPGGLTESAAKILDTWPRQWTADKLSGSANRIGCGSFWATNGRLMERCVGRVCGANQREAGSMG